MYLCTSRFLIMTCHLLLFFIIIKYRRYSVREFSLWRFWNFIYAHKESLINLCYCNNKKLLIETVSDDQRNTNGCQERVASSENETSESPRDNFSTSKPVDMFDSNLSQLCGVDGVRPPTLLSLQTLLTNEVANHDEIAFSTEKFCRLWQLSRRIWFTIVSVDENTNSEMFRTISTWLWQRTFFLSLVTSETESFPTFLLSLNKSQQISQWHVLAIL